MVTGSDDTGLLVAKPRPSERRKTALTAYVADRLSREKLSEGRGYVRRVATATGFTPPHVSTISTGQKNVGEDFADAIASFWKFVDVDGLEEAALEWYRTREVEAARPAIVPARSSNVALVREAARRDSYPVAAIESWVPVLQGDEEPLFTDLWNQFLAHVGALHRRDWQRSGAIDAPSSEIEVVRRTKAAASKVDAAVKGAKKPPLPKRVHRTVRDDG